MYSTICILGRQSALSVAELEAVAGAKNVVPFGKQTALLNQPEKFDHNFLGGTIKIGTVVASCNTTNQEKVLEAIEEWLDNYVKGLESGKLNFGLSFYGFTISQRQLHAAGLRLKKHIQQAHSSVRVIPPASGAELNSAQVIHNGLTKHNGLEILIASNDKETVIAQTTSIQDIEAYGTRDFDRPKRDMFVGMLPPKLAQIMLNLAGARAGSNVVDPFCGTGVVLMEAALLGCTFSGTDLKPKMIDYSKSNLEWLAKRNKLTIDTSRLVEGDARTFTWPQPIDQVVTEAYLGPPLTAVPKPEKLKEISHDCDQLIRQFLVNLHSQLSSASQCVIAIPAWQTPKGFYHLPLIDQLGQIGYNQHSFSHVRTKDLLYYRKDQVVARELLIVSKR